MDEPGNEVVRGLETLVGWLPWLSKGGEGGEVVRMHSIAWMILLSHPISTSSNTYRLKEGKILTRISMGLGLFSDSRDPKFRLNKLMV